MNLVSQASLEVNWMPTVFHALNTNKMEVRPCHLGSDCATASSVTQRKSRTSYRDLQGPECLPPLPAPSLLWPHLCSSVCLLISLQLQASPENRPSPRTKLAAAQGHWPTLEPTYLLRQLTPSPPSNLCLNLTLTLRPPLTTLFNTVIWPSTCHLCSSNSLPSSFFFFPQHWWLSNICCNWLINGLIDCFLLLFLFLLLLLFLFLLLVLSSALRYKFYDGRSCLFY